MVKGSLGIAHKALKRSDIKQSDTHVHKHFSAAPDRDVSKVACSARIPWRREKGNEQVGSRELCSKGMALWKWGLKGASSVLWYGADEALTHTPPTLPSILQQESMLYERGSPFTLITAVTWHAVGCPSVLNIYVSLPVLPWWLSRLWHVLSPSFAHPRFVFLSHTLFNKFDKSNKMADN